MSYLVASRRRDPFAGWFYAPFRAPLAVAPRAAARPAPNGWTPSAEVVRNGNDAVVRLEVPGLKAEDISVEVADGRLVVSGERRNERSEEKDGRAVREIRYGSFRRSFGLPDGVGEDVVSASYDAGVLTVTVAGIYAEPSAPKGRVRIPVRTAAPAVETAEQPADAAAGAHGSESGPASEVEAPSA